MLCRSNMHVCVFASIVLDAYRHIHIVRHEQHPANVNSVRTCRPQPHPTPPMPHKQTTPKTQLFSSTCGLGLGLGYNAASCLRPPVSPCCNCDCCLNAIAICFLLDNHQVATNAEIVRERMAQADEDAAQRHRRRVATLAAASGPAATAIAATNQQQKVEEALAAKERQARRLTAAQAEDQVGLMVSWMMMMVVVVVVVIFVVVACLSMYAHCCRTMWLAGLLACWLAGWLAR